MNIKILFTLIAAVGLILACGCTGTETAEEGDTVYVQYTGTYNDGTVFDESEPGSPLSFTLGENMMIPGFEDAVYGMKIGESKSIHLTPDQAYGYYNPDYVWNVSRDMIPEDVELYVGGQLIITGIEGDVYPATVLEISNDSVTIDVNHRMAGQELNFEITLVDIAKN